jgi:hypothetical protein
MGDMVATDVTVTLDPREADFFAMATKVTFPSIAFGAASGKAYPTGGIPMPAMGAFGMKKEIKRIFVSPRAADGILWKYDKVNHKLMALVVGGSVTGTISANSAGSPSGNLNVVGGGAIAANDSVGVNGANVVKVNATNAAIPLVMDAMANHTHVLTAGDVTDAAMAEYANADMAAKVLDLMVIGS